MGDTPYTDSDASELLRQMNDLPNDAPFIYHLGDLNRAKETGCNEMAYIKAKRIMLQSKIPLFVTPGDNDWNDCPVPDTAWGYWEQHFMNFDTNWSHSLGVRRMPQRNENVSFFIDFVLFVSVNIVGGAVHDEIEWDRRLATNLQWTMQEIRSNMNRLTSIVILGHAKPSSRNKSYFEQLSENVKELGVPTLYIHGDGHEYDIEKRAFGVRNMWDVQVDRGGKAPPLKVRVTKWIDKPFEFDRRK